MLVCGEAAGSTYALTGEGIGKAMETALHAAEAMLAHGADEAAVAPTTGPGSRAASRASTSMRRRTGPSPIPGWSTSWSGAPGAARAGSRRLAGVLEETYLPKDGMSLRGILRRVFDLR